MFCYESLMSQISLELLSAPTEAETEELSRSAALLYGLIHARYIITSHGLEAMVSYESKGCCWTVFLRDWRITRISSIATSSHIFRYEHRSLTFRRNRNLNRLDVVLLKEGAIWFYLGWCCLTYSCIDYTIRRHITAIHFISSSHSTGNTFKGDSVNALACCVGVSQCSQ